ncbi:MAG: UvrD-helicase domain-containing protein [Candidatus Paceibacterota bacterium]
MLSELNDKQREAVEAGDEPLLIVAGAGSGKTKTLTTRLAYLIAKRGVKPESILAITFTNKAAHEMKDRALALLHTHNITTISEPFLGTFHSFGAWILRREAKQFNRTPDFSIFDDDDSQRIIKKIFKEFDFGKEKVPAIFRKEISRIKNEFLLKDAYTGGDDRELMWEVYERYEHALEKNNAFDFDDLIEKPVRLFRSHTDILSRYQKKFTHILVDEYQDANMAQYWLVRLLAGEHHRITVVGDDAQSIYKFRFSDFRNFLNFEKDWPTAQTIFLEQNYRSTKHIIQSSSGLIAQNEFQKKKELWTHNPEGGRVLVVEHDEEFSQADYVVQEAQQRVAHGMRVGILYRTNAQSRALEQVLLEYDIPYELFGALSFYERREIKDIVAALRFAINPQDSMSYERLEKNFGKRRAAEVRVVLPLWAKEKKPAEVIASFMAAMEFENYLKKHTDNFTERMENIAELIYFAQQFSELSGLIEKISLADTFESSGRKKRHTQEGKSSSLAQAGIFLMTIHLAKGLEFDSIFVVGVNEGVLPHQHSLFSQEDLEEERRLMYVAMTRARNELVLNFYQVPSRFLYELPPETVYFKGERSLNDEERYITYD